MKIQRLVFPDKNRCEVEEADLSEDLSPNEVLLKTRRTLVSAGTELAMFTRAHRGFDEPDFGYAKYPFHPGYSAVCEVLASNHAEIKQGARVFAPTLHATFAKAAANSLIHVPEGLGDEHATFFGLLQIAMTSPRLAPVKVGEQVVVIGMGIVGNLCAQLYAQSGAGTVAGADLAEFRLSKALACGVTKAFNVGQKPLGEWVKSDLGSRGAELVVEAIGASATIADAMRIAADRGIVVLLGSPRSKMEIDPYFDIHRKGIAVIGAHGRNVAEGTKLADRTLLMNWLRSEKIRVSPLVTQHMHFTEGLKAYEGLRDRTNEFLGVMLTY